MTVLVGFIPTPEGWSALAAAIQEARLGGDRLVVINTSRGDGYVDPRYAQESHLAELKRKLDAAGVRYELQQQMRGLDAADEVLEAAEASSADLIVIGIRRRSRVGKLIMGSTSQRILLEATCAVLAVKAADSSPVS